MGVCSRPGRQQALEGAGAHGPPHAWPPRSPWPPGRRAHPPARPHLYGGAHRASVARAGAVCARVAAVALLLGGRRTGDRARSCAEGMRDRLRSAMPPHGWRLVRAPTQRWDDRGDNGAGFRSWEARAAGLSAYSECAGAASGATQRRERCACCRLTRPSAGRRPTRQPAHTTPQPQPHPALPPKTNASPPPLLPTATRVSSPLHGRPTGRAMQQR